MILIQKSLALLLSLVVLCASGALRAEPAPAYLHYMPDVPLMGAMTELSDEAVIFDKAEGRVIESVVFGANLSETEVNEFYRQTLPGLGWAEAGAQRFLRNGEQLIVKCEKLPGGVRVRFAVSPKQGQKQEKNF